MLFSNIPPQACFNWTWQFCFIYTLKKKNNWKNIVTPNKKVIIIIWYILMSDDFTSDNWYFKITSDLKIFISVAKSFDILIKEKKTLPLFQRLSVPFINKDASSNSSLGKMSMKYLCCPHKVIPLQKSGDFLL